MKIAILHNYMDNIGGAEVVNLILARELGADIYTTNINTEFIKKMGFSTDNIYSIGKVPINAPFKQESTYWRFRFLNIEKRFKKKYDHYIIAGDWAMAGAYNNSPNTWYCYSPSREIWDLYPIIRKENATFKERYIYDTWVFIRKRINRFDIRKVDHIVAISKIIQERVKKYLNRDSKVIFAPTETTKYHNSESKGYWLSVNRLNVHKRVEMQLKAFKKMPDQKLIIVGSYEKSSHFQKYAKLIKDMKPDNVEIRSWLPQHEVIKLYSECQGLVTSSRTEDYGMNVVEAMSSGKPVIAPKEGGYAETIKDIDTGILITDINEDKIIKAVRKINKNLENNKEHYKNKCIEHSKNFDTKRFIKEIMNEIPKPR
ncbi:MAG: glycosyltransferase involved in cell wall biosynthesis [Patescibacteria group bacterium]|jgi:glycosyltransferase involved in cell wall biosynthesis